MTAINFCFDQDRAYIATDSMVSIKGSDSPAGSTAKAWSLPHLGLVVAGAGPQSVMLAWLVKLISCTDELDVLDLDIVASEYLRDVWNKYGAGHSTTIFHFGIERATQAVAVFQYASQYSFASQRYPEAGAYAFPSISEPASESSEWTTEAEHPAEAEPPQIEAGPTIEWSWHDRTRAVIGALSIQQQRHPASIGGRIHITESTTGLVRQLSLGEIPLE